MRDDASAKKCGDSPARAVKKLIDDQEFQRAHIFTQRTNSADGQDLLNAKHLERVNVRSIVDLRRRNAVAAAVTRKKRNSPAFEGADHQCIGWLSERGLHTHLTRVRKARHSVESAAADDSNRRGVFRGSFAGRLSCFGHSAHLELFLNSAELIDGTGSASNWPLRSCRCAARITGSCAKSASQPFFAICGRTFFLFSSVVSG